MQQRGDIVPQRQRETKRRWPKRVLLISARRPGPAAGIRHGPRSVWADSGCGPRTPSPPDDRRPAAGSAARTGCSAVELGLARGPDARTAQGAPRRQRPAPQHRHDHDPALRGQRALSDSPSPRLVRVHSRPRQARSTRRTRARRRAPLLTRTVEQARRACVRSTTTRRSASWAWSTSRRLARRRHPLRVPEGGLHDEKSGADSTRAVSTWTGSRPCSTRGPATPTAGDLGRVTERQRQLVDAIADKRSARARPDPAVEADPFLSASLDARSRGRPDTGDRIARLDGRVQTSDLARRRPRRWRASRPCPGSVTSSSGTPPRPVSSSPRSATTPRLRLSTPIDATLLTERVGRRVAL